MNITFDEQQLMSLYNPGTREGLITALTEMRGYLAADEAELRELTDSTIAKLNGMTDAELIFNGRWLRSPFVLLS